MILKKITHKLLPPPSSISSLGPNRIGWVDWSKAIGILFVVMGHSDYSNPDIVPMILGCPVLRSKFTLLF